MMRHLFAALVVLSAAAPAAADDYPHVYLKNDKLKVKVYLPDAEKGFYRGTRFDRAGLLGEVEFAGHKIFGPWKDTHDPTNHDDIVGPAEEFGIEKPLGYDDAKAGGTFLKIGVGELEKPKEEKYSFAKKYKVVKPAEWKELKPEPNVDAMTGWPRLIWEMKAAHPSGYGYEYTKSVIVAPKESLLMIDHVLKNTGTKAISTEFYNHNFFNVDGDPVGPDYSFTFGFDPEPKELRGKFGELVEVKGKELRFKDKMTSGFVMAGLTGFDSERAIDRHFEMRHAPSGVRVTVFQTQPLSKFNIWGVRTTICPEPYSRIELKPGEKKIWRIVYTFEHDPPKK